ncbi:MAG: AEC family transporter [Clostridia bacterium]|nr:AEC family transporter [Clostridia bacterium]
MQLVFQQIIVILLYVVVGYVSGKIRLIQESDRKYLTRLCSTLILPFTILSASSQHVDRTTLQSLLMSTVLMFCLFGGTTLLSLIYHKIRKSSMAYRAATTGLVTYPNCTFLGLPLCTALFGEMAILYNAGAMIVFNVLFFTVQYGLFTAENKAKSIGAILKNLLTPSIVSTVILILMLFMGLHFPLPVQTVVSSIGSMISPLSLIIIGVMLSEHPLMDVIREKQGYVITFIRNLLVPALAALALSLLPMDPSAKLCVLVYISCPCATLTAIYAIQCGKEAELCARTVLLSTLLFSGTLPLMISFGQLLFC